MCSLRVLEVCSCCERVYAPASTDVGPAGLGLDLLLDFGSVLSAGQFGHGVPIGRCILSQLRVQVLTRSEGQSPLLRLDIHSLFGLCKKISKWL
ncbi:hypothetical protein NPIL_42111 [Nephila pilipes]|uniref:Uncharacterized protein n=1 Tax=Nephila pilipes TaxID=299642 RepID=A0A8X6TCM4_NEPPI|nr:hypothetical protein NPIL_42111 [Nephila pilipes]